MSWRQMKREVLWRMGYFTLSGTFYGKCRGDVYGSAFFGRCSCTNPSREIFTFAVAENRAF